MVSKNVLLCLQELSKVGFDIDRARLIKTILGWINNQIYLFCITFCISVSSLSLARFISNQPNLSIRLTGLLQNYRSLVTEWIFQCFMIYFKILYFLVISTLIWSEDLQEVECEWIRLWVSLWPKFNLGHVHMHFDITHETKYFLFVSIHNTYCWMFILMF